MDARSLVRLGMFACLVPLCAACAEGESAAPPLYSGSAGDPAANGGGAGAGGASGAAGMMQAGTGGAAGMTQAGAGGTSGNLASQVILPPFSFFVTSQRAMQRLSGSELGFGGDLRFGKLDGLSGADEICRQIADHAMEGSGAKGWRAFLSVTNGPSGKAVHARDRIGAGPWYDRNGHVVAANLTDLIQRRPAGDPGIAQDLPNEDGIANSMPMGTKVDNHRVLTGTGADGSLYNYSPSSTCLDWTSAVGAAGRPRVGHSQVPPTIGAVPSGSSGHWISAVDEAGCAPGGNSTSSSHTDPGAPTVGSGGGYGGIYCFALMP